MKPQMNTDERRIGAAVGDNALSAFICVHLRFHTALLCALCASVVSFLLGSATAQATDVVVRRGEEGLLRGTIVQVDDAGVLIRTEQGASQLVPWDRVRRVETDAPIHQQELARFEEMAEELWRARSRLERRDAELAEPIFEKYFASLRGRTHETALVAAEGLLRCRLERMQKDAADGSSALMAALEVARLRSADVTTMSYRGFSPVLDSETRLCSQMPPVWDGVSPEVLAQLERELAAFDAGGDLELAVIATLYLRSVQQATRPGESDTDALPRVSESAGAELLRDLVLMTDTNRDAQRSARARVERRMDTLPEWVEAWARYHIGRSMMQERTSAARRRGALNIAHLPARFSGVQPYLARIAHAQLIAFHEAAGERDGAASLRAEFARRYPHHTPEETAAVLDDSGDAPDDEQ